MNYQPSSVKFSLIKKFTIYIDTKDMAVLDRERYLTRRRAICSHLSCESDLFLPPFS